MLILVRTCFRRLKRSQQILNLPIKECTIKAFVVDGKLVITGGRNIADEYFDYDHEYNFRDRDILLMGGSFKPSESFL